MEFSFKLTTHISLSSDIRCFLYLVFLRESSQITEAKFRGMLRSFRAGHFNTFRQTYHCAINDQWYSERQMLDILADVTFKLQCAPLDIEKLVKYVNLWQNKNRNYCLNVIFDQIVQPVLADYDGYNEYQTSKLFGLSIKLVSPSDEILESGHCCEDCDGPLWQYKQSRFEYRYLEQNKKVIEKTVSDFFLSQRKVGNPIVPAFEIF